MAHCRPQQLSTPGPHKLWECRLIIKQPPLLELICQDLNCPSLSLSIVSSGSQTQVHSPSIARIHIKFSQSSSSNPCFHGYRGKRINPPPLLCPKGRTHGTNLFKEIPPKVLHYWSSTTCYFTLSLWTRGLKLIKLCFWSYFWKSNWSRILFCNVIPLVSWCLHGEFQFNIHMYLLLKVWLPQRSHDEENKSPW